jgi:hypothetical protein
MKRALLVALSLALPACIDEDPKPAARPNPAPPEAVQRVVGQSFGRIRTCYTTGLAGHPGLTGHVLLRFPIGPDGVVGIVTVLDADLPDQAAIRCVAEVFRALTFPPPASGHQEDVTYNLAFDPPEDSKSGPVTR